MKMNEKELLFCVELAADKLSLCSQLNCRELIMSASLLKLCRLASLDADLLASGTEVWWDLLPWHTSQPGTKDHSWTGTYNRLVLRKSTCLMQVHKKVENKLAEAAQDRKKAEIDAEHKAAEKKAAAQQEAEDIIAAAKEKAEAIKRGEEVAEKPSTIKKILGMS